MNCTREGCGFRAKHREGQAADTLSSAESDTDTVAPLLLQLLWLSSLCTAMYCNGPSQLRRRARVPSSTPVPATMPGNDVGARYFSDALRRNSRNRNVYSRALCWTVDDGVTAVAEEGNTVLAMSSSRWMS